MENEKVRVLDKSFCDMSNQEIVDFYFKKEKDNKLFSPAQEYHNEKKIKAFLISNETR